MKLTPVQKRVLEVLRDGGRLALEQGPYGSAKLEPKGEWVEVVRPATFSKLVTEQLIEPNGGKCKMSFGIGDLYQLTEKGKEVLK